MMKIGHSFFPLLEDRHRYLVLCGGGGSGKSEFAGRKLFLRAMTEGNHRFLVLRKVRRRVKESVVELMLRILAENEIQYEYNRSDLIVTFTNPSGQRNEFLFDGLDDPEKIKSIKGITGIWLEETTEFTSQDFLTIDLRLREPCPSYHQIILSFNPDEAVAPWIKERFFDHGDSRAIVHRSTIDDNPIDSVRLEYRKVLDALAEQDETYYTIYRLGQWARPKGRIYNWPTALTFDPNAKYDEVFYGGDFGYSVNEAAVVRVWRRGNDFWLQELVYEKGLTNHDLAARMRGADVPREGPPIYFDAAEPKSIQEIRDEGFNAVPAVKGADSVRAGIDFLKSQRIHIIAGSENLIKEASVYKWREDKTGRQMAEPVKFMDHLLDAARYAIYSHAKEYIEIGYEAHP